MLAATSGCASPWKKCSTTNSSKQHSRKLERLRRLALYKRMRKPSVAVEARFRGRTAREERALRPVELGRAIGLSAQQVRRYERWGYLPPAERTTSGHRRYGPRHLHAILAVRAMQAGYGWFTGGR